MQRSDYEPKKLPTQARSRLTYAAMLQATVQVLLERGYAQLTTNQVAEVAGVSIGTLYEYFPHKKALVATAVGAQIDELTQDVLGELRKALRLNRSPHEATVTLIHALAKALEVRRDIVRIGLDEVPFFWEIPKARHHVRRLMRIARRAQLHTRVHTRIPGLNERSWVLVTMVWLVLVQNAIHRPRHLDGERVVAHLAEMISRSL